MQNDTLKNVSSPTLIGLEEQPEALSEGWRLFLTEIRQLAAEGRRRRAAAATENQTDTTQQVQSA